MTSSKAWTKEQVRSLRLRLGWSQPDLARRLNVDIQVVTQIEDGEMACQPHHESFLNLIKQHADLLSEEMSLSPIADSILESQQLPQIDRSSLLDQIK